MHLSSDLPTTPVWRRRATRSSPVLSAVMLVSCYFALGARPPVALAQDAASQPTQGIPASALVTKTVQAVGFQVGGGSTKLDLKGTELMPGASGEAKVEVKSNAGRASIDTNVKG